MKVILLEPLENLGDVGQVVDVKPGYARNYLLPRGLAVLATESNLKALEARIRAQAKRLAEFFNGEVVQLDGPLLELEGSSAGSQAA